MNSSIKNAPFLLRPAAKDYLWGGNRLNTEYAKEIDMEPLAETWECSTHSDGVSMVASGEFYGMLLTDVLDKHPEYLGSRNHNEKELPILVKFIDANKDLSIQVHPDDEYALIHENGQRGKTEMWYVLDASKEASLIYGLATDVDKGVFEKALIEGKAEKYLQKVPVHKNEVYFVQSGTVHAIGKGCLIAEIQESSNLTYRLYDYNREDKFGNKRELHIDKGLAVANLNKSAEPRQPLRILNYKPGVASELIRIFKNF